MLIITQKIARKYAVAFLRSFQDTFDNEELKRLQALEPFLAHHRRFLAYAAVAIVTKEQQTIFVNALSDCFGLGLDMQKLLFLLIKHKRLTLIYVVVKNIITLYYKNHNITFFQVSTSHSLDTDQKEKIHTFIHNWVPDKHIKTNFLVAPELISGIKIKSDSFLWERSINKQLQNIKKIFLERVGP